MKSTHHLSTEYLSFWPLQLEMDRDLALRALFSWYNYGKTWQVVQRTISFLYIYVALFFILSITYESSILSNILHATYKVRFVLFCSSAQTVHFYTLNPVCGQKQLWQQFKGNCSLPEHCRGALLAKIGKNVDWLHTLYLMVKTRAEPTVFKSAK